MLKLLKMMLCRHNYMFNRRLYGDEINCHHGKRNEYKCLKCGMYRWNDT